jgi:hypothetical protein
MKKLIEFIIAALIFTIMWTWQMGDKAWIYLKIACTHFEIFSLVGLGFLLCILIANRILYIIELVAKLFDKKPPE